MFALACMPLANASIMWKENVHGDLSGDRLNPNHLTVSQGTNTGYGEPLKIQDSSTAYILIGIEAPVGFPSDRKTRY